MPKFNYVRTKFNLYKHYLNHQMMDVDDYNYDSDGDFKMSSPKKLRKSILKRTKKGTITEILSYKRVIFSDNQVVIYYLSDDEKKELDEFDGNFEITASKFCIGQTFKQQMIMTAGLRGIHHRQTQVRQGLAVAAHLHEGITSAVVVDCKCRWIIRLWRGFIDLFPKPFTTGRIVLGALIQHA